MSKDETGKTVKVVFLKSASHKPFFLSYGKGQTANVDEKMAVQLSKDGIAIDHETYLKDQKDDSKKEAGKDADSGKDDSKKEATGDAVFRKDDSKKEAGKDADSGKDDSKKEAK